MDGRLVEDIEAAVDMQVRELDSFVELNPYLLGLAEKSGPEAEPRETFTEQELTDVLEVVEYLYDIESAQVRQAEQGIDEFVELPSPSDQEVSLYLDNSHEERFVRILAGQGKVREEF